MVTLVVAQFAPESVIRAPTGPCPEDGLTNSREGAGVVVGVSVGVGEAAGAAEAGGAKEVAETARDTQNRSATRLMQALRRRRGARRMEAGRWPGSRAIERLTLHPPHHYGAVHDSRTSGVGSRRATQARSG
jgi:hypothetical protein